MTEIDQLLELLRRTSEISINPLFLHKNGGFQSQTSLPWQTRYVQ